MRRKKNLLEQLGEFLESGFQNLWLKSSGLEIYVRLNRRILPPEQLIPRGSYASRAVPCLDIANISQAKDMIGKGHFQRFMIGVEAINPYYDFIYVENVFNPKLAEMLVKHGYETIDSDPPCFWKQLKRGKE